MPITKTAKQLVDEAMLQVKTYTVQAVRARLGSPDVQKIIIQRAL